jgi:hypothetical protein
MTALRLRRSFLLAMTALAALPLAAGCSGVSHAAASRHPAAVQDRRMRFRLADASAGPVSAEVPGTPIGSTPTSVPGVTLQLYVARRVGPQAVLVVFGLATTKPVVSGGEEDYDLSEGLSANPVEANISVSEVSLFDPAGLNEYETYMVNPDIDATCLCSAFDRGPGLPDDTVTYYAALVAAPPADVTSVSFVTGVGTISDVPLGG